MTSRQFLAAAALAATLVAGTAGSAGATELSLPEVSDLAEAAAGGDVSALEELRTVTSVDEQPIDLAAVLSGDTADVEHRLRSLAALEPGGPNGTAGSAREEAAAILAGREFQRAEPATTPGWLQRFSEWLAGLVPDEVGRALTNPTLWAILAIVAVGTLVFLMVRNARRRNEAPEDGTTPAPAPRSAADLERRARDAEDAGDYSTAVRLRFEAGAIRLAERGIVARESTSTSGALRRAVPTPTMASLTRTFDRVAYGRRSATPEEATAAERGWTAVIEDVRSRG